LRPQDHEVEKSIKLEKSSGAIRMTPLIWICIFYVTGILLSPYFSFSSTFLMIAILLYSPLLIISLKLKKAAFLIFTVFLVVGIAHPHLVIQHRQKTEKGLEHVIRFSGIVTTRPNLTSTGKSFSFILKTDLIDGTKKSLRFFTFIPKGYPVSPGNRINGIARIQRNDSRFFLGKELYGNMSIEIVEEIRKEKNYHAIIASVRELVLKSVTYGITGDNKSLIEGLMLGVRTDMPPRIQRIFSDTGTVHILAVSGLHLGIIAFVVFFLIRLVISNMTVRLLALAVAILLYTMLIGDVASLLRAAIMTEIGILALLLDKDRNYYNITALSACILLSLNPYYIYNIGFQLSYAAVIGMIAFNGYFLRLLSPLPKFFRENIAVSFSAQMIVIPFILVYFHRLVLISYVVNILAVPLSSVNIILGFVSFFIAIPGFWTLVKLVNILNSWLMTALIKITDFFAGFYYVRAEEMHLLVLVSIIIFIVSLYIVANHKSFRKGAFALALCAFCLLIPGVLLSQERVAKIIIPNMGYKDDAFLVIADDGRRVLYLDATTEKATHTLPKLLMANNTDTLDLVVIGCSKEQANLKTVEKLEEDFQIKGILLSSTNNNKETIFGETHLSSGKEGTLIFLGDSSFVSLNDNSKKRIYPGSGKVLDQHRFAAVPEHHAKYIVKKGKEDIKGINLSESRDITVRLYVDRTAIKQTKW